MPYLSRRRFLRTSGAAGALAGLAHAQGGKSTPIALVLDGDDAVAASRTGRWAAHELQQALTANGYPVRRHEYPQQAEKNALTIIASGSGAPVAASALAAAKVTMPAAPESLALLQGNLGGRSTILACGNDPRGLSYALLELAERARQQEPLAVPQPVVEQPANAVRSVMRQFVSELYDKPWFYDRAMWPKYFAMLAAQRFNRFNLTFGLAYDMLKNVQDSYFLFLYPFVVAVPGYDVRATGVSDAERQKNLDTLRYISEQCTAAGLDFELGIWMHGYQWSDSPKAQNVITGLTPQTHASYCHDALKTLLQALPAVSVVGLRIHGESGVPEGSYGFWKAVFQGAADSGRKPELDLHAKGIDDQMIETALATGLPVAVAPKYSAEHQGLPYHPAEIRPSEIPKAGETGKGLMALSEGQRSFTRYGYADLLRDDRKYKVRARLFTGTQKILMWGNAAAGAAYARSFSFCGMDGADLMEPLTYRGRRGTAVPGIRRSGYVADKIEPQYDWEKYDAWYRTFGRTMYNPDGDAEVFHRAYGDKALSFEAALAPASLILPLVTTVHSESAACDLYWPEIAWNFPLGSEIDKIYWDTPSPRTFQNVTALDPQLFSSCSGFADELLSQPSGKYSPVEAALWLETLAADTEEALSKAGPPRTIPLQRLAVDAEITARLGLFFAAKMRAGVLMALYEKTGDRAALEQAVGQYKAARAQWATLADPAHTVYAPDLSVSDRFTERGQWSDRLAGIDADIATLEARLTAAQAGTADQRVAEAVARVLAKSGRQPVAASHTPPAAFTPGQAVTLEVSVPRKLNSARLWYRHVNQAERWIAADLAADGQGWRGAIPADYTASPYPLQYYFAFRDASATWLHPGFAPDLLNTPYFVVRRG